MVIKTKMEFESGKSFITYKDIQEYTGFSPATINKGINQLIDGGFITQHKESHHHNKVYYCVDFVPVFDSGTQVNELAVRSIPAQNKSNIDSIKEYISSGDNVVIINNQNITINITNISKETLNKAVLEALESDVVKDFFMTHYPNVSKSKKES
jgi:DNA-binding Lrp family transcriptional regulator